jgi:DUF2934 family protein
VRVRCTCRSARTKYQPEVHTNERESAEEMRGRAYEICLERGEQPGRELDEWLQAELERGVLGRTQAGQADNR